MLRNRRPLRKLSISKDIRTPAERQREAQERYFVKLVTDNSKYKLALSCLKEGVPVIEIASHFANNGWITVNERTFAEALRVYRRLRQADIDNYEPTNIDKFVDPNSPGLDIEASLAQVMRLQKERIAIEFANEKTMTKLFDTTYREFKTFGELAELALKAQGKVTGHGAAGSRRGEATSQDVHENLNLIKKDENTQNRLHGLTRQLVEGKQ